MTSVIETLVDDPHDLRIEPQPIADQVMAICSCGWRHPVSLWEFPDAHAEARLRFADHYRLAREGEVQ